MIRIFTKAIPTISLVHLYDVFDEMIEYATVAYADDKTLIMLLNRVMEYLGEEIEKRQ